MVILQHDTEIGEGVRVIFYSVYQHLHTLTTRTITTQQKDAKGKTHTTTEEQALKAGDTVYRKDALGTAGAIYGKPHRIHLEILADEANVAALMGRARGPLTKAQLQGTLSWLTPRQFAALPAGRKPARHHFGVTVIPSPPSRWMPMTISSR